MTIIILLTILFFLSGSLMFSYWTGRLFGYDIREYGDGNPGAANAFKVAGIKAGFPSLVLDFLKGAIPLFIAFWVLRIND